MNGDQFFNATFTPNGLSEFPPFPSRPKASRSPLGAITSGSGGGSTPLQHSPGSSGGGGDITEQMAGMSMTPQKMSTMSTTPIPPAAAVAATLRQQQPIVSTPSQFQGGRNPAATEFVPKANSPATIGLNHSASSPAFQTYAQTAAVGTINQHNLAAGLSPMGSPGLSPSGSPMVGRRAVSPAPTYIPTTAETVGGTTYFYSNDEVVNNGVAPITATQPNPQVVLPNFTMYPGILPHVAHMKPKSNLPSFFMPDDLKMEILNRHAMTMAQIDHENAPDIPAELDNYHNLFPLEPVPANPMHKSATFGNPTTVYKATNMKDGLTYCLRRVHGFRLVNTKCMALIDTWKKIQHANMVQLREVFTTKAFNDHSIVFVYDFHPGAETLMQVHFSHPHHQHNINGYANPYNLDGAPRPYSAGKGKGNRASQQALLPESQIWSYVVQLSSALRTIHAHGLSCRVVDPTKLLLTDKSRLRINCVGIFDVLTFDTTQNTDPLSLMPHYQQDDLMFMGKVILALACGSLRAFQQEHVSTSLELVQRNYSTDLKNLFVYLFTGNQSRCRSVNDIMPMIGARFYSQLDASQLRNDVLENELAKEVENSRLFRLMCKLGVINDRPEFHLDPAWSETGDRYMLKLYRDHLFHQVDETSKPWIDMAHVVHSLNKLDAGIPEKVVLMSRDEQSVLVVTYSELKRCLESAFAEVIAASQGSGAIH